MGHGAVSCEAVARTPTTLTAALARDIPPYIRDRGDKYVRAGRVAGPEWSETRIVTTVLGSEVYVVGFSRDDDAIVVSCTCPYFLDRGPCKHVWAAAVVIDQDPRWDGSWLEGGPLIDYDIGIDDPYDEADEIDAVGGPAFLPPSCRLPSRRASRRASRGQSPIRSRKRRRRR